MAPFPGTSSASWGPSSNSSRSSRSRRGQQQSSSADSPCGPSSNFSSSPSTRSRRGQQSSSADSQPRGRPFQQQRQRQHQRGQDQRRPASQEGVYRIHGRCDGETRNHERCRKTKNCPFHKCSRPGCPRGEQLHLKHDGSVRICREKRRVEEEEGEEEEEEEEQEEDDEEEDDEEEDDEEEDGHDQARRPPPQRQQQRLITRRNPRVSNRPHTPATNQWDGFDGRVDGSASDDGYGGSESDDRDPQDTDFTAPPKDEEDDGFSGEDESRSWDDDDENRSDNEDENRRSPDDNDETQFSNEDDDDNDDDDNDDDNDDDDEETAARQEEIQQCVDIFFTGLRGDRTAILSSAPDEPDKRQGYYCLLNNLDLLWSLILEYANDTEGLIHTVGFLMGGRGSERYEQAMEYIYELLEGDKRRKERG